jgi:hypothetical protein
LIGDDDSKLKQIAQIINPEDTIADNTSEKETEFFSLLRRQLRSVCKDIRAMYSLSVFPPKLWNDKQLAEFFLPEARKNIASAVALAKHLQARQVSDLAGETQEKLKKQLHSCLPDFHFRFSPPLYFAIKNAKCISKLLKITENLKNSKNNLNLSDREKDFVENALDGNVENTFYSLSIWDNIKNISEVKFHESNPEELVIEKEIAEKLLKRTSVDGMHVSISKHSFIPKGQTNFEGIAHILEFPRILLWNENDLDDSGAIQCIQFHENCAFPLFWLLPDSLKDKKNTKRRFIGHFSILDSKQENAVARWNDEYGGTPIKSDPSLGEQTNVGFIWNSNPPQKISHNSIHYIDEFVHLLNHPNIMFAADAWAVRKMGEYYWEKLKEYLESEENQEKIKKWRDDPNYQNNFEE